jgi:predicted tellurium resistance membrane protein TerC
LTAGRRKAGFVGTIAQIVLFDIVFSLDSVITAVGIAEDIRGSWRRRYASRSC